MQHFDLYNNYSILITILCFVKISFCDLIRGLNAPGTTLSVPSNGMGIPHV